MKKALYGVFTALPMLLTPLAITTWYLGLGTVLIFPLVIIAAAVWFFAIFRSYKKLTRGGRIFLIAALWIIAVAACLSPYAVLWLAFQGGHHI